MKEDTPILEASGLKLHFPVRSGIFQRARQSCKAVDGVSLHIHPGEPSDLSVSPVAANLL